MAAADRHATTGTGAESRRALMAVLARASADDIERGLQALGGEIAARDLRAAETGLVMVRGRVGGDGAAFNLGEATVTRAAIELASGERGFSYVLGRDRKKARLAALCDALWQSALHRAAIEQHVYEPLAAAQRAAQDRARAQTAATRVDFFTLVRGEDPT